MPSREKHYTGVVGWLRAAVLGANDGLISTASLIIGVAAASPNHKTVLLAGMAGLVSGALSMAAGEYVSVSSQADSEEADLALEDAELKLNPEQELAELRDIYIHRGLSRELAQQVAVQLTNKDVLEAHARDELGILEHTRARPVQAAFASAGAFTAGASLPIGFASFLPVDQIATWVGPCVLLMLFGLGALAARLGGAKAVTGGIRVAFWGAVAMIATFIVGNLFGTVV